MPISVMVVDDSNLARHVMANILEKDEAIEVCAALADGESAISFMQGQKPDVITMDLNMPGLNGMEVTKRIMSTYPTPIIIVTTDQSSTDNPFQLLEAGAIAVLRSPAPPGHPEHDQTAAQLIRTIKALSTVKVYKRRDRHKSLTLPPAQTKNSSESIQCIAIGASTGGPQILKQIFEQLPADFPIPIVVTQHIAKGFSSSLTKWLQTTGGIKVQIATDGQLLERGNVYIAPDDYHLGVSSLRAIQLVAGAEYKMRPAIGFMFKAVGATFGKNCAAILLSGMGRDGASEMAQLKAHGALTIAQDKESSLIHSMPGEAIACGGVCEILAPDAIIAQLLKLGQTWSQLG